MNQDTLRVDLYKDLISIVTKDIKLTDIDQRIVLSSSFIDGPRVIRINYHDIMIIIHNRDRSDYFIIMIYNIKWKEIIEILESNQIV
jgi:hypothetical protein